MGKETAIWDDSVLIQAFDDAMNKGNKGEHPAGSTGLENPSETNIPIGTTDEHLQVPDSCVSETNADDSGGIPVPENAGEYTNSHAENYTQLYNQYLELDKQMNEVLNELYHSNYWKYSVSGQESGTSTLWNAGDSSHYATIQGEQPCSCYCLGAYWPLSPPYIQCQSVGKSNTHSCQPMMTKNALKPSPPMDDNVVKKVMGAAEKVIPSTKTKVSVPSNACEGEHKAEELEDKEWEDHNSETDISVVINAWYAAGFYTGKYYSEQSTKRRQP
ncbi:hypothetical protein AMTRI_Chr03g51640 [Amborella trichopoda]